MADNQFVYSINPWMDFASYKTKDAQKFKGREEDIQKFSKMVDSRTMTVLYAESGIGKTSFLNAGISPIYIEKGFFPIHILFTDDVFDGTTKKHSVEEWLISQIRYAFEKQYREDNDYPWTKWLVSPQFVSSQNSIEIPAALEKSLWWFLHNYSMTDKGTGTEYKPLIIFDQFEEVFVKAQKFDRTNLLQDLFKTVEDLSNNSVPKFIDKKLEELEEKDVYLEFDCEHNYKVIFSLRKEYLSDFDYWTNDIYSITELYQNRMFLLPLNREQAGRVITQQPNSLYCKEDEIESITEHVETLSFIKNEIIEKIDSKHRNRVEPFILSVLCSRLFEYAKSSNKQILEASDLDTYNINTIIREFYEEKVNDIFSVPQDLAFLEEVLVDEDGNRNRKKLKELRKISFEEKYRQKLEKAHLVRIDSFNSDELYVELIHDKIADAIVLRRNDKKEETKKKHKKLLFGLFFSALFVCTILLSMCNGDNRSITYQTKDNFIFDANTSRYGNGLSYNDYLKVLHIKCNGGLFRNCPLLSNITFSSEKDVNVGNAMFASCGSLKEVVFADSCENIEIGDSAFADCPYLKTLCISSKLDNHNTSDTVDLSRVRKIGREAFRNCKSISNVIIDSVQSIADDAFKNCYNLKNVTLRGKFSINKYSRPFAGCPNVVFNTDSNCSYKYEGGFLIYLPDTTVIYANNAESERDTTVLIEFPEILSKVYRYNRDGIKINKTTFLNKSSISKNISDNTIIIKPYLWYNGELEVERNYYSEKFARDKILILDLTECKNAKIDNDVFKNCTTLERIIFPSSLKSIGYNAFEGCTNIKELDFSMCNIESISGEAFKNCTNLKRVVLPHDIKEMGSNVFEGCTNLNEIVWGTCPLNYIPNGTFKNCKSLQRLFVPSFVTVVNNYAFQGCVNLKTIDFTHFRSIGSFAFEGCGLTSAVLPDTLDRLYMDAFMNCNLLNLIRFPSSVSQVYPATNWKGNLELGNIKNSLLSERDRLTLDTDSNLWFNGELIASFNTAGHNYGERGNHEYYSYQGILLKQDSTYNSNYTRRSGRYIPKDVIVHIPPKIKKASIPQDALIGSYIDSADIRKINVSNSIHYFENKAHIFPDNIIDSTSFYVPYEIYCKERDSILEIPPIIKIGKYKFIPDCKHLKEIHLPFTEIGFEIDIPSELRSDITLYVPKGTKNKYLQNEKYRGYKSIEEDSSFKQVANVVYFNLYSTWRDIKSLWGLSLLILALLLLSSYAFANKLFKKEDLINAGMIKKALLTIAIFFITVICTMILYFFIHCGLGEHEVIGLIFSLYLICAAVLLYRCWVLDLNIFND